jgi:signal transduction histidine kinase
LYQLIIQDNGTAVKKEQSSGIGLANISDRVASFNGNLNISTEKGFRIFISIPKNMEGER